MKKILLPVIISIFFFKMGFSQVGDRFSFLNQSEVTHFAQPLATTLGAALNSSTYNSAAISKVFGFALSFNGMLILIPDEQKTFMPNLPSGYKADTPTPTIYGPKNGGGVYAGPNGYIVYPTGLDISSIPVIFPQAAITFSGTKIMLRYIPNIKVSDREISLFGVAVSHSISQYIPLIPLDIAIQGIYGTFKISELVDAKNYAFNVHASKTLGILTLYGGMQYESSKFDLSYSIKGDPNSGDPALRLSKDININIEGANKTRLTVGGTLKLGFLVLNSSYSFSKQPIFASGMSFEF